MHYSNNARPAGNQDLGTTDNHDVNPTGTVYTKSVSTPTKATDSTIKVDLDSKTVEVF